MPEPRYIWSELDNRTITGNVAYAALSSLFTVAAFFDQIVVDVAELTGSGTPTVQVYGQRVSDNVWVPLAAALTLTAGDAASTYVVDIPAGIYDNVAYRVAGNASPGVDVVCSARADAEAA